jgi:hypothetical protein
MLILGLHSISPHGLGNHFALFLWGGVDPFYWLFIIWAGREAVDFGLFLVMHMHKYTITSMEPPRPTQCSLVSFLLLILLVYGIDWTFLGNIFQENCLSFGLQRGEKHGLRESSLPKKKPKVKGTFLYLMIKVQNCKLLSYLSAINAYKT